MLTNDKPASERSTAAHDSEASTPEKGENQFVRIIKKTGFTIWLAVMVIGGALAFIVALFLV